MSDKLSEILSQVVPRKPVKSEDPDQRVVESLEKALENTTPERAGAPWDDKREEESERTERTGLWFPEGN